MLNTYRAVLRGQLLEWLYEQPQNLPTDQAVAVHVTILDETSPLAKKQQGRRMATALEQIAKMNAAVSTVDARQWERQVRQERKMTLGDSLIAATCLVHGFTLVTRNTKDFTWIPNLTVLDPLAGATSSTGTTPT